MPFVIGTFWGDQDGCVGKRTGQMRATVGTLQRDIDDLEVAGNHGSEAQQEKRGMRFTYPSGSQPLEGYTIKRGIGIGGFGEVYFALSDAGKEVALKRIQRNLDIELRGVRQCLNLKHVNLISLWDIRSNEKGESWVVMEYVPGQSLREVLEQFPKGLPEADTKKWFASIAAGVSYLHDHGIVHRDLKPGNVFHDNDEQVIKIGDYGLSKFMSCSRRSGQTESVGTFHYMAPEIGKGVYGKEIDVYAMGVMLFEMLSGQLPFDGESAQEIIMKHLTAEPDVSILPELFRKVVELALQKDPEDRFHNVAEMCAALPWEDVASSAQSIVSRHSIGPLSLNSSTDDRPTRAGIARTPPSVGPVSKELEELVFLENHASSGKQPDIVFGPLYENNQIQPGRDQGFSTTIRPIVARSPVVVTAEAISIPRNLSAKSPEPIARAVRGGMTGLLGWFNNPELSTPLKVFGAVVVALVLIINSAWLIPVALGLGLMYLMYYTVRSWFVAADHEVVPKLSRREMRVHQLSTTRHWLGVRPVRDRVTELMGSLLVSAIAVSLLSLLGLAIGQSAVAPSIESWAVYTWMTITAVLSSWGLLISSKSWEHREGDSSLRRLTMTGIGAVVGLASFGLAQLLFIDFQQPDSSLAPLSALPTIDSFPPLVNYLIFFAAMFGILRWWNQADPNRKTRLSLVSVGLCLVCAVILSHVMNFEPIWNGIFAVVVSISTQLAAPWIMPQQRAAIYHQVVRQ